MTEQLQLDSGAHVLTDAEIVALGQWCRRPDKPDDVAAAIDDIAFHAVDLETLPPTSEIGRRDAVALRAACKLLAHHLESIES